MFSYNSHKSELQRRELIFCVNEPLWSQLGFILLNIIFSFTYMDTVAEEVERAGEAK